jgi:hypothetical protein
MLLAFSSDNSGAQPYDRAIRIKEITLSPFTIDSLLNTFPMNIAGVQDQSHS